MSRRLTVKLDEQGRLTIPEGLRKKHGWNAGTTFFIHDANGTLCLASAPNPFEPASPADAEREAARIRLFALIDQVRNQVPKDLTDEELDTVIDEEIAAARRERRARRP
jgi:bifunctional DNA-binding transcriptional regulator/antitoxin component of YhaV-PrlF toxin-antitoxin module